MRARGVSDNLAPVKRSFGFLCRESGEPGVAGAWCLRWLVLVFDSDSGPGKGRGFFPFLVWFILRPRCLWWLFVDALAGCLFL